MEEIVHDSKIGINLVHECLGFRRVVTIVTDDVSDLRAVFLFDVGVVVFFVRAGAGELYFAMRGSTPAKAPEMVVDELGPVVGIDAFQVKGQARLDGACAVDNGFFGFAKNSLFFVPSGMNVHRIEGVKKVTGGAGARVGDEVDFQEPGPMNVPEVCANGDHVFEQGARLGCAIETFFEPIPLRGKTSIHLTGADGEEFVFCLWIDAESLASERDPVRESGFEPLGTEEAGGSPDGVQGADGVRTVKNNLSARFDCANRFSIRLGSRQQPDGVLAMAAQLTTKLVQDF